MNRVENGTSSMEAAPVLSVKNIQKSYGKHEVLSGVTMDVRKGAIYGLVGKNGSGKTTLFKIILGLSPYNEGSIVFGFEPGSALQARRKVGFLIGECFFPYMNGKDNLLYHARLKGCADEQEVDDLLRLVGLEGVKQNYKGYSLGMKQRLGVAKALLGDPELVFLDEPTNGLDPQGIADFRVMIRKLNEERGTTIVISSHILSELQNTASRFFILDKGVVVRELSEDDLLEANKMVKVSVDDLDRAVELLQAGGVEVLSTERDEMRLEDFYFDLLGESEEGAAEEGEASR